MTLKEIKDKLEIGLKPDAPYRPTNLPESEQDDTQLSIPEPGAAPDAATGQDDEGSAPRVRKPGESATRG